MSSDEELRSIRARIDTLADLGRDAEVAELARRGLALAPDDAQLLGRLAMALRRSDPKEAVDVAARAAAAAPDSEWAHRVAAWVHLDTGRRKAAVRHAERAVALAPHDAATHLTLAATRSASGDHRGAAAACDEAVRLAPNWSSVWVERSRQSIRARDWPAAERWARHALELRPDDPAALNNLAVALEQQGRRPEALDLFARAAAADPRDEVAATNARSAARGLGALGIGTFTGILAFQLGRAAIVAAGGIGIVLVVAVVAAAAVVRSQRRRRELAALPVHLQAFAIEERRRRWRPDTRADRIGLVVLGALVVAAVVLTLAGVGEDDEPSRPTIPPELFDQLTVPD